MSAEKLYLEGELYLSIETVAELYRVRTVWLREVYDAGLLGRGVPGAGGPCIAAVQLDRVASIVRLHLGLGLDLEAVQLALGEEPREL